MDSRHNFEEKTRRGLALKATEVIPSEEILKKALDRLENDKGGFGNMLKDRLSGFGVTKYIAATLCGVLAILGLLFTFSEDTRAIAGEAFNRIKSVFVVERDGDGYKIVEKPLSEVPFTTSYSSTTYLSDAEIGEKVGFKVCFPQTLSEGYKLNYKSGRISVNEYEKMKSAGLESDYLQGFHSDRAFEKLKEYEPSRSVGGNYVDSKGNTIWVFMWKMIVTPDEDYKYIKVKIGDIDGYWTEVPLVDHHAAQKPTKVDLHYCLSWATDETGYLILPAKDSDLTMVEAIKVAESFMKPTGK